MHGSFQFFAELAQTLAQAVQEVLRLDTPDAHGLSQRDHLNFVAAELGQEPAPGPEIPPWIEYLWDWFWELRSQKMQGPLSWSDLAAWQQLQGNLASWQIYLLREMDKALLGVADKPKSGKNYD